MNLIHDNIKKLYIRFLLPSLGSAMVLSIYTLTDAIVVGKGVGSDALAALSIITPPICILIALGILVGVGGSVHMNIARGQNDSTKANQYFTVSFLMILAFTVALWILYYYNIDSLLRLMGASDYLFGYAKDYMRYVLMFFPVPLLSTFLAIFVRSDNDPNRAMLAVIGGGITNIVLDIVMVYPLQWGIGGAAFASMLGMLLQVLILSTHFLSRKNGLKLCKPTHLLHDIKNIITSGLSSFINELANGFIVLLFNIQILRYCGNAALAVYSVISNCIILFNSLFTGVGQASQPIISVNFGAGEHERIKCIQKMAFSTVAILGVLFTLLGLLFPHFVCGIFIKETAETAIIANYGIRLYFLALLPMSINVVATYYLQSILRSGYSFMISLSRNIILSGLLIVTLPLFLPANVLWIIMPCVELLTLILTGLFIKNSNKSIK